MAWIWQLPMTAIKFPEINRFPDYPAVEKYTKPTREYLLYKLAGKKHHYGYDVTQTRRWSICRNVIRKEVRS